MACMMDYDLFSMFVPGLQETYMRRVATCLAAGCFSYYITFVVVRWYRHLHSHNNFILISADGIVINMVVGGEVVTLKNIEESSNLVIAEMPINVSCLLHSFIYELEHGF